MRLDRILTGILAYINTLLWWRKKEVAAQPYERLKTWRLEGRGMLHLVKRSAELCPRDVCTFFFVPFRYGRQKKDQIDIHLCCDHLEGMAGTAGSTHRITILQASHWPGSDGLYEAEELFQADYDLQGRQSRRDMYIRCILHRVAFRLNTFDPIDWGMEIEQAKKECMGDEYTTRRRLPGQAIAMPYDEGTKPVKIKF